MAVSRAAAIKVVNTSFSACSVTDASSISVVSGGAGLSLALLSVASLTESSFDGGQDSSGASEGLLLLSSSALPSKIAIDGCSFSSTSVSVNVTCIDAATGFNSVPCVQPGPTVSASNSNISQLGSLSVASDFSNVVLVGSVMIALQQNVSLTSSNSLIVCNSTQFAVFRKLSKLLMSFQYVVYFCSPCPFFQLALTSNVVLLDVALNAPSINQCMPLSSGVTTCPFGIAACTTFVNVTSGFWANFSNYSVTNGPLTDASRCPPGYCSCNGSSTCPLPPPLAYDRNANSLCAGNRTGVLCGGCPPNFTQSIDGKTCISNEDCEQNLGWVWTLSVFGYAAFSLYIVLNCGKHSSGIFSCVLFYFQMSSFASSLDESNTSNAILHYSQFVSIVSLYSKACYAPNISAYNATLARLIGPLFVLVFAVVWTRIILALQPRLQQRNIEISVSYSGTLAASMLFVFSSVASVVFSLVQCSGGVVFIDGTVACYDSKWKVLIAVVVLLCLVPVAFAVALRLNKLPENARATVCQAYTAPMFYWGAVTLGFRLLISVTLFLQAGLPNVLAFVRLFLSTCMLLLLVHLRPYVHPSTFWVDVVCYVCLIAQFGLQTMVADRDFLGVAAAQTDSLAAFFLDISTLSSVFRCGSKDNANLTVERSPAIANAHDCRYLPVAVFAIAWLRTQKHFGNFFKALGRRAAALARSVMQRFSRGSNAKEMKNRLL